MVHGAVELTSVGHCSSSYDLPASAHLEEDPAGVAPSRYVALRIQFCLTVNLSNNVFFSIQGLSLGMLFPSDDFYYLDLDTLDLFLPSLLFHAGLFADAMIAVSPLELLSTPWVGSS